MKRDKTVKRPRPTRGRDREIMLPLAIVYWLLGTQKKGQRLPLTSPSLPFASLPVFLLND